MRTIFIITTLFMTILSPQAWSFSCSSLRLRDVDSTLSFNSNPTPLIQFKVKKNSSKPSNHCYYIVGFTKGTSPTYSRKLYNGVETLDFQLYKDSNHGQILMDVTDASGANNLITGHVPSGNRDFSFDHDYYASFTPPNGLAPYGHYSETINIKLYVGFLWWYVLRDEETTTFTYFIPKLSELSLVPHGAPYDPFSTSLNLNFGHMNSHETKDLDIIVKSNAGYELYLSSYNDGKMKHATANSHVNYNITIDGNNVDLNGSSGSPVLAKSGSGMTPNTGLRFYTQVTLGIINDQLAGNYSDTITVTVATNE